MRYFTLSGFMLVDKNVNWGLLGCNYFIDLLLYVVMFLLNILLKVYLSFSNDSKASFGNRCCLFNGHLLYRVVVILSDLSLLWSLSYSIKLDSLAAVYDLSLFIFSGFESNVFDLTAPVSLLLRASA